MKATTQKTLKVAKILDEYSIVLNGGANRGIKEGDRFRIVSEGENILDPDTGAVLGNISLTKGTVKASQVFDNMCICRSDTTSAVFEELVKSFVPLQPLNVDTTKISPTLSKSNQKIMIGDVAEKISEPEVSADEKKDTSVKNPE